MTRSRGIPSVKVVRRKLERFLSENGRAPTPEEAQALGCRVLTHEEVQTERKAMGLPGSAGLADAPPKLPPPQPGEFSRRSGKALGVIGWLAQAGKDHPEVTEEAARCLVATARAAIDALADLEEANSAAVRAVAEVQTSWPVIIPTMPGAREIVIRDTLGLGLGEKAVNIRKRGRRIDLKTPENSVVVRLVRDLRGIFRGPTPKQDPEAFLDGVLKAAKAEFRLDVRSNDMDQLCRKASLKARDRSPKKGIPKRQAAIWQEVRKLLVEAFSRLYVGA